MSSSTNRGPQSSLGFHYCARSNVDKVFSDKRAKTAERWCK